MLVNNQRSIGRNPHLPPAGIFHRAALVGAALLSLMISAAGFAQPAATEPVVATEPAATTEPAVAMAPAATTAPSAATAPAGVPAPLPAPAPRPAPTGAVSPLDGQIIGELAVVGLERIDEAYVRTQIRSRSGQAYSQEQVQGDVGRLLRTGRFIDVKTETQVVNGQVRLTFHVAEKPEIASVEFAGNKEFKVKDLTEALSFAAGDPLDLYEIRRGREAIERKYKEKGYGYVQVAYDISHLSNCRQCRCDSTFGIGATKAVQTVTLQGSMEGIPDPSRR